MGPQNRKQGNLALDCEFSERKRHENTTYQTQSLKLQNTSSKHNSDTFLTQPWDIKFENRITKTYTSINLHQFHADICGPGSSVGIATGYGLDGPGIESRWGARFFAPVQTGPGAHTASCTMSTGSFSGVKSPSPHLVPWSRKGRTILLLPLWAVRPVQSLSACTRVTFIFTLPFISYHATVLNKR